MAPSFSRLTPVALRAPSVSREKDKSGTSYFAQNRNFLLCLDRPGRGIDRSAQDRYLLAHQQAPLASPGRMLAQAEFMARSGLSGKRRTVPVAPQATLGRHWQRTTYDAF